MTVSQRDLVLIRFPFSNQVDSKPRPVIVISNDNYNKQFLDFLGIPVTTKKLTGRNHTLSITNKDLEKGYLDIASTAKVDKISSIEQNLVIHKIGSIRKDTFKKLKDMLLEVI